MNIKNRFRYIWSWRRNNVWGWIESILITLLALAFCKYINPNNPLFVREIFPWPWIASVIVVFQYGFGPGILSVAIIALSSVVLHQSGLLPVADFQAYVLSGITLMLICALFSSSWVRRMMNAETLNNYSEDRLKSLSRSYYMLRISYDYLEQNLITKPMTLRIAFAELQKINWKKGEQLTQEASYSFLQIISQFCSVNTLGIYKFSRKKINLIPYAEIGSMNELILADPLIKQCIETEEMAYATINKVEDASDCNYLIAMPMISSENNLLGLLVIKEMPFWSLNDELLRTLSILVTYFTNNVIANPEVEDILTTYPGCNIDFAKQLIKMLLLKRRENFDSALVAVLVSKTLSQHNVVYNLKNQHRLLDSYWVLENEEYDILITLMPFTEATGIHGYNARITNYLRLDQGLSIDNEKIKIRTMQVYEASPKEVINYFLHFIGVNNFVVD